MLRWIKRRLRAWLVDLLSDSGPVPRELAIRDASGSRVMVTAVGVQGSSLVCTGDRSEVVVKMRIAIDSDHWMRLFVDLGGVVPKWGDGTPVDLMVM